MAIEEKATVGVADVRGGPLRTPPEVLRPMVKIGHGSWRLSDRFAAYVSLGTRPGVQNIPMEGNMKSMIKSLGIVALAAAALGIAAAQAETVALVTINQQALFFNQVNDGAKQAADKAGAKLVIFNANNNAAAQNSAIEVYIAQKVDGIVLVAIDVNGVKPAI